MVLHTIPLSHVFALNACHAWGQGLELAGPSYEERDMLAELARITEERKQAGAHPDVDNLN